MKRTVSGAMLVLLLLIMLELVSYLQPAQHNTVHSVSSITSPDGDYVGFYWDSACTKEVTSVDWQQLTPGRIATKTLYCRNVYTVSLIFLGFGTIGWDPQEASGFISSSCYYGNAILKPNDVIQVNLTLAVSLSIVGTNITGFSFNYIPNTLYATDLDFDGDGQIGYRDISIMLSSYGSHLGDPRWNPITDIVTDNKIDLKDLALLVRYYGKTV
jgi:hypothetical protein